MVFKIYIIGGGIVGALEAYYAYHEALKHGKKVAIIVYEKGESFISSNNGKSSTNTSYNIVPSLTIDEILSVVPRGPELVEKLGILFTKSGGIYVEDVSGVNDSEVAIRFKEAATVYGSDKDHEDRTWSLLMLGKKSMDLWQQMYDEGGNELRSILEISNFHPCREPKNHSKRSLGDGYRVDLIYGYSNAMNRALSMQANYEKLGYKNCAILSPDEVVAIDPYLADFCEHYSLDVNGTRVWQHGTVALWRPGGCIDTRIFLPKFYNYLKKIMGQYQDSDDQWQDCFMLKFGHEITAVNFDQSPDDMRIIGLQFSNGTSIDDVNDAKYVFCPGESIGTLHKLGFKEPTYSSFAGTSLFIKIPIDEEKIEIYRNFSQYMELHREGIVLAWQARFIENHIFIGAAGTKAFYGDKEPDKNEEFAKNRTLVQLNMVNDVLSEILSLPYGYKTKGKTISAEELSYLEKAEIASCWVGRRAVAYDGFPTIGALYYNDCKVMNARCTTHLGSGGVSCGPGAVLMSRDSENNIHDEFTEKFLNYADSRRTHIL